MSNLHEEEALGKAYDSHLMRRLLKYMKPYRWRVGLALALVAVVTPLELAPPAIFQKAIDGYLVPAMNQAFPESKAWMGVIWLSLLFLAVLSFDMCRFASCSGWASKPCTTCGARFSATCSACP